MWDIIWHDTVVNLELFPICFKRAEPCVWSSLAAKTLSTTHTDNSCFLWKMTSFSSYIFNLLRASLKLKLTRCSLLQAQYSDYIFTIYFRRTTSPSKTRLVLPTLGLFMADGHWEVWALVSIGACSEAQPWRNRWGSWREYLVRLLWLVGTPLHF